MAKNDRGCVAISSLLCAEVYGLEVIDTEVQDGQGELAKRVTRSVETAPLDQALMRGAHCTVLLAYPAF